QDELDLHAALTLDPRSAPAHLALAERYLRELEAARAERDTTGAARARARMHHHLDALPRRHPGRRALLAGFGPRRVRVCTDVPAEAVLERFEERGRRLVPVPVGSLGTTPVDVELEPGSYRLVLTAPDRDPLVLPVRPGDPEPFVPPGSSEPVVHVLPVPGLSGCPVPAGWFEAGGDPGADDSLPLARVWVDAFVMARFPVTNAEYIAFLDALVDGGDEGAALRHAPRERAGAMGELGALVYGRDTAGHFHCQVDADGDPWDPDEAVTLVDWEGASAYAAWRARVDGLPWRLPRELEWEKAARGVDGRLFPWGDHLDPSWCCMRDSHAGRRRTPVVQAFPTDASPYGVRGLGGGVRDWCADAYRPDGPVLADGREVLLPDDDPTANRVERGGAWYGFAKDSRSANRFSTAPTARFHNMGFRLCRSWRDA
ncbi:MAG: SUMF1/EgtB/PvdO family nonheme iron enzyme, partial [Myxococcales bacterium]|nr:SUMF1/EgtB/PvdO family nonheme iron enzyme [Myxococcales bacterium]